MDDGLKKFGAGIDVASIERIERDAWLDMFAAAPRYPGGKTGLNYRRLGASAVLAEPDVPIVEFNRGICIGIERPETEASIAAMLGWLQAHASPQWALQISPATQLGRYAVG